MLVYVIAVRESGPCKIGITRAVDRRITMLQTGNPEKLKAFHTRTAENPSKLERQLHDALISKRLVGEWFDISVTDAIAVLENPPSPLPRAKIEPPRVSGITRKEYLKLKARERRARQAVA